MGGFLKRLASRLQRRRRKAVPLRERFQCFLKLCEANETFLQTLASLQDKSRCLTVEEVKKESERLSEHLHTMVEALNQMSQGRYKDLATKLEELERDIAIEVFKERPLEYGKFIVWPSEEEAIRLEVVGGKAAHLASLYRAGLVNIPPFFVITTYAFYHFMECTGLFEAVEAFFRGLGELDNSARASCEALQSRILTSPLPSELKSTIMRAWENLVGPEAGLVAVRSSAVVEEAVFSFAGQFETVLGVRGEEVEDAYRRVIASKFRLETLKYVRLSGLLDQEVAMAVMVMTMVDALSSGVAYTRAPQRPDVVLVSAVNGLCAPLVEGRVEPDRFLVERAAPHRVVDVQRGARGRMLRAAEGGGGEEVDATTPVDAEVAREVAKVALLCERHFGQPQDVEWALGRDGSLFVIQSRPLIWEKEVAKPALEIGGYRVLIAGGVRASGGIACGKVVHLLNLDNPKEVEAGSVVVVPATTPRLAGVVGRAAAILAATGSATGHMATVAREFHVPMLVGLPDVFSRLPQGAQVTVDAWAQRVYEGDVAELLGQQARRRELVDPAQRCLARLLEKVSPLSLQDPYSLDFKVSACASYHDIARFAHQKAMTELFLIDSLTAQERRETRWLDWRAPLPVLILDLGGGLEEGAGARVSVSQIKSAPFSALIEGMTDPRVSWAGPVGFDLKGFMSVVMRSAADDQRYGEPSFAIISRDFVHFSSRLAYHFATVASFCGRAPDQNYVRFAFHGGAARAERREWRAYFLSIVLRHLGFVVRLEGDRVDASLGKRCCDAIEETLTMVGRLMVCARHLDMVMENRATAEAHAVAFLAGDYGFETLRERE